VDSRGLGKLGRGEPTCAQVPIAHRRTFHYQANSAAAFDGRNGETS